MSKTDEMRIIDDQIFSLKESPLYNYRTENHYFPVIGEGSYDSKIMFVGEAPGKNEAKTGKPFCGAAGKVLDKLLDHVGSARNSVYITSIVKDRPPENRDPTPREIEIYGPFLDRQIKIIKPEVIVALGRYAMNYLLKKYDLEQQIEPISNAHGKAYKIEYSDHKSKSKHGMPKEIVVLYHPSVALYNSSNLPSMKKDFEVLLNYAK